MSREPGIREIIALLIALALTIVAFVMTGCNGLRKENERLREELAKAQQQRAASPKSNRVLASLN